MTPSSSNQLRSFSVSRSGDNIVLRWDQLTYNGKTTELFFERLDTQTEAKITLNPLAAGVGQYTLPSQALATDCGSLYGKQLDSQGQSSTPSIGSELGSSDPNQNLNTSYGDQCSSPPAAPDEYAFADSFHHRDHLGTLRIVSDAAGAVDEDSRHDFYPFGTEIGGDDGGGSRKRYTGHERDEATGADYMLARYSTSSLGAFASPDPVRRSYDRAAPQSWNRRSYVRGNPVMHIDPRGLEIEVTGSGAAAYVRTLSDATGFDLELDNGAVQFASTPPKKRGLSRAQKKIRRAILRKRKTQITAVVNDPSFDFGRWEAKGHNSIDMGDAAKLASPKNQSIATPENLVLHETLEAATGLDYGPAHKQAVGLTYGMTKMTPPFVAHLDSAGMFVGFTDDQPLVGDPNFSALRITVSFVTPFPWGQPPPVPGRQPQHIVDVESIP